MVALRTARRAARSGLLWGYVFGLTVASASLGYVSTYKTLSARAQFASLFASNSGLAAINGRAVQIQTVGGYTVWKCLMFLAIAGAIWGLLLATKLLRGEEEAGRWELLLAGRTTRRGATAQAIAGLGAGVGTLWVVTAAIAIIVGHTAKVHIAVGAEMFFALTLVAVPGVFVAAGALTSQLAATRRQAAGFAGVALGVCYALRMVADSASGLGWLRWTNPLGWVEEVNPLTAPRPVALMPVLALIVGMSGLAIHLAGRRDLGASVIPDRVMSRPHTALLSDSFTMAVRLVRPTVLGWVAAIGATGLLMGFIAKQGGKALTSSSGVEHAVSRLGLHGGGVAVYLGFTFLVVAVLVALLGAGLIAAARAEEVDGRLDHLLVRQVSRWSWLVGRWALAAGAAALAGLLAGLAAWLGAASQGAGIGLSSLLGAGVNVVSPTLCVVGAGVFVFGVWPRATNAVAYGVLAWGLLIEIAAGAFSSNHWLLDTSVFHQMASVPAVPVDWASTAGGMGTGVLAALLGLVAFQRRDITSE